MTLHPSPSRLPALSPSLLPRAAGVMLSLALLAACAQDSAPPEPPLPSEALEAVVEDPGVPREPLARAVDELFTADSIGETHALLVLHDGQIVAERYGEGYGPEHRFSGWSMSKSVTGVLLGMMVADGRLRLDDPAPIAHWQRPGDPRSAITLRHLMQMRSGLRHVEAGEPAYHSDEVQMLFLEGRGDMAGWAEAQPLEHEPGAEFAYSTATTVILADVAADTIEPDASADRRQQAMTDYVDARLAVPLGMESLLGEYDASGTLVGGSHFWATPRDWARFGEFLRRSGSVEGAQIVPRGWIDFMRTPSPAAPDYGGHLWLNHPSGEERDNLFDGALNEDIFAAIGHLGQYIIVAPDRGLTVVRLGRTIDAERPAMVDELADIVALYPSG